MRGKVKWEGMWVIFVECVAYSAALVSPDADFVSIRLTNGIAPQRLYTAPNATRHPSTHPCRTALALAAPTPSLIAMSYRAFLTRHVGRVDALRGLDPNVSCAAHDPGALSLTLTLTLTLALAPTLTLTLAPTLEMRPTTGALSRVKQLAIEVHLEPEIVRQGLPARLFDALSRSGV